MLTATIDVLDLQLPELRLPTPFVIEASHSTTLGDSEKRLLTLGQMVIGEVVEARNAYRDARWLGSEERWDWTIVLCAEPAREAARSTTLWPTFVQAIHTLLRNAEHWRCIVESDCEQAELQPLHSAHELVEALMDVQRRPQKSLSYFASEARHVGSHDLLRPLPRD